MGTESEEFERCQTSCRQFRLVEAQEEGTAQVVMLPLQQITAISSVRVFIHKDLRPPENCQHGIKVNIIESAVIS